MIDLKTTLAALLAGSAAIADAQLAEAAEPPTPEAVRSVLSYYYSPDSETPVLSDFKLCRDVHREGSLKNECTEEVLGETLPPGETVYAWMNFLVPKGERGRVLMQFKHDGVTRDTSQFGISGSVRYRTWRKIRLSREGEWLVPIWFENENGLREIDRVSISVAKPVAVDPVAEEMEELKVPGTDAATVSLQGSVGY